MKLCLVDAMRKGESPKGKMDVEMTIAANGTVVKVGIGSRGFDDSPMAECTMRRVKNWRFPKFNGKPVLVSFPVVLSGSL